VRRCGIVVVALEDLMGLEQVVRLLVVYRVGVTIDDPETRECGFFDRLV
jgi:hypothetical protein